MEINTVFADELKFHQGKQKYDAACKRTLSEKIFLAYILKECVAEYKDVSIEDIVEKYLTGEPVISQVPVHPGTSKVHAASNEDVSEADATVTYDIRFYAIAPKSGELIQLIINVEAQGEYYTGYPLLKRVIYYCSRQISAQYGVDFENAHYEKIIKVYSIWICLNPPGYLRNCITKYRITEEPMVGSARVNPDYYDLITGVMVYLGGPEDGNYEGLLKLLDVVFTSECSYNEKKEILQNEFNIPMTKHLEDEVSKMGSFSDFVERRSMEKGMQKGMEKGLQKGMEKGLQEGLLKDLKNLLKNTGWSLDKAMDMLDVPASDRSTYTEMLKTMQ